MRLAGRCIMVVLAALPLGACSHWHPLLVSPREALADPDVRHVRLTRMDAQRVELHIAEIRGDTIYGTSAGSDEGACLRAPITCQVAVPLSDVGLVEERRLNLIRTAMLVLAPLPLLFVRFNK